MSWSRWPEIRDRRWYAKPNDLIGGWCVMPVDATPGESRIPAVANLTFQEGAEHMAELHNAWLEGGTGEK